MIWFLGYFQSGKILITLLKPLTWLPIKGHDALKTTKSIWHQWLCLIHKTTTLIQTNTALLVRCYKARHVTCDWWYSLSVLTPHSQTPISHFPDVLDRCCAWAIGSRSRFRGLWGQEVFCQINDFLEKKGNQRGVRCSCGVQNIQLKKEQGYFGKSSLASL